MGGRDRHSLDQFHQAQQPVGLQGYVAPPASMTKGAGLPAHLPNSNRSSSTICRAFSRSTGLISSVSSIRMAPALTSPTYGCQATIAQSGEGMGRATELRTRDIQDHNLALCQLSYARHPRGGFRASSGRLATRRCAAVPRAPTAQQPGRPACGSPSGKQGRQERRVHTEGAEIDGRATKAAGITPRAPHIAATSPSAPPHFLGALRVEPWLSLPLTARANLRAAVQPTGEPGSQTTGGPARPGIERA